jgi:hypothetical protein
MHHRIILAVVPIVVLSGCGQRRLRTVVVAPSASVAQLDSAGNYVYIGHQVSTTGTIKQLRGGQGSSRYVLTDRAGHTLALLPASVAAKDDGRRVLVTGIFDVRFEFGSQLTLQQIHVR